MSESLQAINERMEKVMKMVSTESIFNYSFLMASIDPHDLADILDSYILDCAQGIDDIDDIMAIKDLSYEEVFYKGLSLVGCYPQLTSRTEDYKVELSNNYLLFCTESEQYVCLYMDNDSDANQLCSALYNYSNTSDPSCIVLITDIMNGASLSFSFLCTGESIAYTCPLSTDESGLIIHEDSVEEDQNGSFYDEAPEF